MKPKTCHPDPGVPGQGPALLTTSRIMPMSQQSTSILSASSPARSRPSTFLGPAAVNAPGRAAVSLSVIEANLAGGALLEAPANGAHSGRKWRVRIFEYGLSKNRYPWNGNKGSRPGGMGSRDWGMGSRESGIRNPAFGIESSPLSTPHSLLPLKWTERSARAALRHLDGARCFADHVSEGNGTAHSVRDLIGFFSEPALGPRGPEATLTLLESERWARDKLLAAWSAGRAELIGFSLDAVIAVRPTGDGAERALEVEDIVALHSVDMVSAPSSGGRALDVLESRELRDSESGIRNPATETMALSASRIPNSEFRTETNESSRSREIQSTYQQGATMKQEIQRILEAIRHQSVVSDPASGLIPGTEGAQLRLQEVLESELGQPEVNPPRVLGALADWLAAQEDLAAALPPEVAHVREQVKALRQQISDAVRRQRIAENRVRLDGKLSASRLPKPLAGLVASRFQPDGPYGGRDLSEEDIEMEIQRVREAYAALSPVGRVMETGRVKVVREPEEKLQMALDRLFNLPVEDTGVPAFHGIREAYVAYTGDGEVTGSVLPHLRVREDYTTAGFPNALGNTLRRVLLKDYRDQDYGIGLIAQFSSVPDFRTQERVRVGYFGDLPTVATESADYGELTAPTDEKATYSVVTFGGLVTVTRKAIINDDIGIVPQIVSRLGRSARRTLAQRVFNLMINNAAIYDALAWFHATHGNLGSTALSAAQLDVVRTAMRNRTEKDSGKKLGIGPHVLVVPNELEGLARQENEREYVDASFTPNRVRFMFGQSSERVIVSPLLSDANDWYVFANVQEAPTVEVGFLQGRQEPEFFLADNPTAAAVFTSDKIRYKVRHEHEAVVIDFRGAYKEVVV